MRLRSESHAPKPGRGPKDFVTGYSEKALNFRTRVGFRESNIII